MDTVNFNQVKWLCRRGMKEMDVMLESFVDHHYLMLSDVQKQILFDLLGRQDPELFLILIGKDKQNNELVEELANLINPSRIQ